MPGLANLGNTCYINALVQCLNACEGFRSRLSKRRRGTISTRLNEVFDRMDQGKAVVPADLVRCLTSAFPDACEPGRPGDVHELFMLLVEKLSEESPDTCDRRRDPFDWRSLSSDPACPIARTSQRMDRAWEATIGSFHRSWTADAFCGQTVTQLRCDACGDRALVDDAVTVLTLPPGPSVSESVRAYFGDDSVRSRDCDVCKQRAPAVRSVRLWRPPDILVASVPKARVPKVGSSLELGEFGPLSLQKWPYVLRAMTCHSGADHRSGHYTAIVMDRDKREWTEIDDLRQAPWDPSRSRGSGDVCMCFFERSADFRSWTYHG